MAGTTWDTDPAAHGTGVTFENNDLTAIYPYAYVNGRVTTGKSSGKWYWESIITNSVSNWGCGPGDTGTNLNNWLGNDAHALSFELISGSMRTWLAATATPYPAFAWAIGDRLAFAVDVDAKLAWARNVTQGLGWTFWTFSGGTLAGDPASGVGGTALSTITTPMFIYGAGYGGRNTVVPTGGLGVVPAGFGWWDVSEPIQPPADGQSLRSGLIEEPSEGIQN